jgi:hypothetical protein
MSNPAGAGGLKASDESSILRDVVIRRRPYSLRELLERGLQDNTNRGFTRHSSGLIGHYASVGREQVVAGLRARAVADGRSTFHHQAKVSPRSRHAEVTVPTCPAFARKQKLRLGRQPYSLDDPWVVARNESGPRYLTKGPDFRAFRVSGVVSAKSARASIGHQIVGRMTCGGCPARGCQPNLASEVPGHAQPW